MTEPERMRASDEDRQQTVDLLRAALDEGRLKMDEYVERMGQALEATTYGELALLHDDLPKSGTVAKREDMGTPKATSVARAAADRRGHQGQALQNRDTGGVFHTLPTAMKVLWTIWFAAVSINVVVWILVGVTTGGLPYPWPLWVAGPAGAALLGVSAGVKSIQRGKAANQPSIPPSPPSSRTPNLP